MLLGASRLRHLNSIGGTKHRVLCVVILRSDVSCVDRSVRCLEYTPVCKTTGRSLHFLPTFDGLATIQNFRNVFDVITLELRFGSDHAIPSTV